MTAPKLRFKEFDEDWAASRIDEIASVTSGGTPSRSISEYWDGNIPWVTTSLVDFNVIQTAEEFITQDGLKNSSAKLFPKNTILMAMYGQGITRGKVAILGIEATTNQACCAIKLNNSFDTHFIFQNLMNRYEEIRDLSNDGGQKNLSAGIIKEIEVVSPSKEEQTKIATFLSTVDEKISQLSQKLHLLGQYKQGMMQKLFSQQIRFKADDGSEFGEWEERKLSEISQKAMYGMNAAATEYDGINKYLRITDICEFSNSFKIDNLTSPNAELDDKYKLQLGDLLFARTGASVGKSYLYREDDGITYFAGFLIKFSLNTNLVIPYFIFLQTLTKGFSQWVVTNSMRSGQPGINAEEYSSYIFKVPCLEEQTKIANFLSAIDQKIDVVSEQLEQAKLWKKGLLQQMFV